MIGLMFTLPSSTDMLTGIGQTASPVLSDLLPLAYFASAIVVAVGLIYIIPDLFQRIFK